MPSFCKNCGGTASVTNSFCTECGRPLTEAYEKRADVDYEHYDRLSNRAGGNQGNPDAVCRFFERG